MRRAILAVTTGCVLLTGAACGNDSDSSTTAAPTSTLSATPSVVASSPAADYTADTKAICAKVDKIFTEDLEDFATELGKMIAYKEAKQTSEANAAEKSAGKELKEVAATVKKATAAAKDPGLVKGGEESAGKITETAGDSAFFDKIKTTKDVDKVLESEFTGWFTPLSEYCGE